MPIISVINYKGGVGKTTITANLAVELAWRGKRVLLLDLDAQASLTFSFVRPDYWNEHLAKASTIKTWFDSFNSNKNLPLESLLLQPEPITQRLEGKGELHLIPSHLGLINVDLELATELGGATLSQSKRNFLRVHRRLLDSLGPLSQEFDLVLIDCPPNFNIVTKTAIVASDNILVPAKPDYLSTLGIDYLIKNLNDLVTNFNEYTMLDDADSDEIISPQVLGVVFTMIKVRSQRPTSTQRLYMNQTRQLGLSVFDSWIRDNSRLFGEAPEYGVPVVIKGYSYSDNTSRRVTSELEAFVTEFERRLE